MTGDVSFAVIGSKLCSSILIDLSLRVAHLRREVRIEDETITCGAMDLQLFLAKKSNNEWLSADTELSTAAFDGYGPLTLDVDGQLEAFEQMHPLQSLNDYFGADFDSRSGQVHVLVVIPKKLWLVTATIQNALEMIGIRARLYAAAAQSVGFYDPALRSDGQDRAFWYERDATLHIRVVFDTRDNALGFETVLHEGWMLSRSSLHGRKVTSAVKAVSAKLQSFQRIFADQSTPQDTASPQQSVALDLDTLLLDCLTAEFRCQRIEDERFFTPYGKAEWCYLVPGYAEYNQDRNNRLALSREMRGYYDGSSCAFPLFGLYPVTEYKMQAIDGRFEVEIFVEVFDEYCKDRVFSRLKAGATETGDPLVMKTFVRVENPQQFCKFLERKHKKTVEAWDSFLSMTMTPAVK